MTELTPPCEAGIFSDSQESLQIVSTGARIHNRVYPATSPCPVPIESNLSPLIL